MAPAGAIQRKLAELTRQAGRRGRSRGRSPGAVDPGDVAAKMGHLLETEVFAPLSGPERVADLGRRVAGVEAAARGAAPATPADRARQVGQLALERGRGRHQAPSLGGARPTSASSHASSGLPRLITRPSSR